MGVLDGPMAQVAASLTSSLGGSGTYTRPPANASHNTAFLDVSGTGGDRTTSVSVAPGGPGMMRLFPESMVEEGDEVAIVPRTDLGFVPTSGEDTLTWKSKTRRVVGYEVYGSGDNDAAYALLLRE